MSHRLILFACQSFTTSIQRLLIEVANNLLCILPPAPSPTRAQAILDKEKIHHHEGGVEARCECVEGKKLGILLHSLYCWAFMVSAGTLGPWCKCCECICVKIYQDISKIEDWLSELIVLKSRKTSLSQLSKKKST